MNALLKSFLSLLLLLSLNPLNKDVLSQESKLSVKLLLEKTTYSEHELIVVKLKFTNNSFTLVSIGFNCSFEDDMIWNLRVMDEEGLIYKRESSSPYDCMGGNIKIKAGNAYETYGITLLNTPSYTFSGRTFFAKGNYSLFYSGWYGGSSDTIKFKVTEDNNNSYSRLLEIQGLKDSEEKYESAREYLYNDSNSKYAYLVYEILMKSYDKKSWSLMKKDMLHYFGINPNAWSTDLYLSHTTTFIKYLQDDFRLYEFLRE